jgi:hypothetical protein
MKLSLLVALFLAIVGYVEGAPVVDQNVERSQENVTISKLQYCLSCKETVNLYIKLTTEEIQSMQKTRKPAMTSLEAGELTNLICDNKYFDDFHSFVKFGCIKLMADHRLDFLKQFEGHASITDITNKAENYKRKRRVSEALFF